MVWTRLAAGFGALLLLLPVVWSAGGARAPYGGLTQDPLPPFSSSEPGGVLCIREPGACPRVADAVGLVPVVGSSVEPVVPAFPVCRLRPLNTPLWTSLDPAPDDPPPRA